MKQAFLVIIVAVLLLCNLLFGSVSIAASDVLAAIAGGGDDVTRYIIMESRLPQALTALMAGAALATAGLMLQTVLHNPLAGPSVLGISSGASLGVALVVLLSGGAMIGTGVRLACVVAAMAGAIGVTMALLALSSIVRSNMLLLIVGLMLSYLVSSVITLLNYWATATAVQSYTIWGMGDFSSMLMTELPAYTLLIAIGLLIAMLNVKALAALQLGENYAQNLGFDVKKTRWWLLLSTGLLTAAVTAWCGPVSFLGLAVPHITRLAMRTDNYRTLVPSAMLVGAAAALLCNLLSTLPQETVIPLNALTPIIGVPVIIYVIFKRS